MKPTLPNSICLSAGKYGTVCTPVKGSSAAAVGVLLIFVGIALIAHNS